jgi:hypothetical protein
MIQNPVVTRLTEAITPIVSIGVGSAICTVCMKNKLNPETLSQEQLPIVKKALIEHYGKFWSHKMTELTRALERVKG